MTRPPIVVIGVGNPMRADDGLGPAVVAALAPEFGTAIELTTVGGETTELLDRWSDRRLAVVVDAVRSTAAPGTIHRIEGEPTAKWAAGVSGHGVGLIEAIGLARALDRLPDRLVLLGVEAADTGYGPGLTPAVEAALPALLDQIRAVLATARPGEMITRRRQPRN